MNTDLSPAQCYGAVATREDTTALGQNPEDAAKAFIDVYRPSSTVRRTAGGNSRRHGGLRVFGSSLGHDRRRIALRGDGGVVDTLA